MKKRLLSLALCGALLCGALAGCGGNETPSTSQEPSSGQTEDEPKILTTAVMRALSTMKTGRSSPAWRRAGSFPMTELL